MYSKCMLCPRECKVNRANGEIGFCGASDKMEIGTRSSVITGKNLAFQVQMVQGQYFLHIVHLVVYIVKIEVLAVDIQNRFL